jgi:hypothetical protein
VSSQEHFDKYEAMAQRIGIDRLVAVLEAMPLSPARVQRALDSGDEHLNSIPLREWDRATGWYDKGTGKQEKCPCCKQMRVVKTGDREFCRLEPFQDGPHSAAERTCVLKHVARYHYAGGEA